MGLHVLLVAGLVLGDMESLSEDWELGWQVHSLEEGLGQRVGVCLGSQG